jgi:serine/threonine-protein kinase ATR
MTQIAPFLVSRISSQPNLLAETCRFLSQKTVDFISTTLPSTLPPIFAACNSRVLDQIAKEVSRQPSHLFLENRHVVLARVFLLQDAAKTDEALKFIVQVLVNAADSTKIDVQSIVKSCVVPLLTELVVVMGDEDPDQAQSVSLPPLTLRDHSILRN